MKKTKPKNYAKFKKISMLLDRLEKLIGSF